MEIYNFKLILYNEKEIFRDLVYIPIIINIIIINIFFTYFLILLLL